jgi:hypothetical protein
MLSLGCDLLNHHCSANIQTLLPPESPEYLGLSQLQGTLALFATSDLEVLPVS